MSFYPKSKTKLLINNIYKSFHDTDVLNNISMRLCEKEFVSIIGPSGCGKSTIFNIISGLILPDSGSIFLDKKLITGMIGRVSYMHQKDLLLPWKKIIDNVSLALIIKGSKRHEARQAAKEYFDVFGLAGFEYKYPHQLSGGMRQRAAFLRTYLFSKDVMLLDEPFGGLDTITKSKMHYWLQDVLNNLNTSVLFITHDIEESILLSDRIYIFSDRPANIKEEVLIDLKRPRDYNEIITSLEFNEIKRHIIGLL